MTAPFPAASLEPETDEPLILALPKGRILAECGPVLARAGIVPVAMDFPMRTAAGCVSPKPTIRCLTWCRFAHSMSATFVATFGAAQIGICGAPMC